MGIPIALRLPATFAIQTMRVVAFAGLNIAASVGIILINKQILSVCNFQFILALLCLNFFTTGSALEVSARRGLFEPKQLPAGDRWLLALCAVVTVLLNNA